MLKVFWVFPELQVYGNNVAGAWQSEGWLQAEIMMRVWQSGNIATAQPQPWWRHLATTPFQENTMLPSNNLSQFVKKFHICEHRSMFHIYAYLTSKIFLFSLLLRILDTRVTIYQLFSRGFRNRQLRLGANLLFPPFSFHHIWKCINSIERGGQALTQ